MPSSLRSLKGSRLASCFAAGTIKIQGQRKVCRAKHDVLGHRQGQLMQTLKVRFLTIHLFSLFKNLGFVIHAAQYLNFLLRNSSLLTTPEDVVGLGNLLLEPRAGHRKSSLPLPSGTPRCQSVSKSHNWSTERN